MKRRSDIQHFEWNTHFLLCGDFNNKHPNRNRTQKANIPSATPIRAVCKSRGELRLSRCIDPVAAEAEYHKSATVTGSNQSSQKLSRKKQEDTRMKIYIMILFNYVRGSNSRLKHTQ